MSMRMRAARRVQRAYLKRENERRPPQLQQVPPEEVPPPRPGALPVLEVWRSRDYLVQVYPVPGLPHMERLSINRTSLDDETGHWSDKIPWEALQDLKRQCGRGGMDAVEIYPRDQDVVNVANMRHLWVLKEGHVGFAWRQPTATEARKP